jgi:putative hydrolase of the HAD superfamily
VLPTLEALRARGVRCGVLSNWDYRLRTLLATFDLTNHFDPILISAELGLAKPDPQIFTLACTRAGTIPAETLYIGDDPTLDLHPALSAGLCAYLIDRTGAHAGPRAITSLTQLSTLAAQS